MPKKRSEKNAAIDFEEAIRLLEEGKTFLFIAKKFNVTISGLFRLMNAPENYERTADALKLSASSYANMAEQVLKDAIRDNIEIVRARELAQHFRWMASKRAPKKYGERVDHDVTSDGKEIKITLDIGNTLHAPSAD